MENLGRLYRLRFAEEDRQQKDRVWQVLCRDFFQRYVRETDTVLDLACGFGEFTRHIRATRKIAVDVNPESSAYIPAGAEFHACRANDLAFLAANTVDVCFTSNFFEHLPTKQDLDDVLREVHRVLRPQGVLVALQPNIKYAPGDYWDYYDHFIPLTHLSCAEALQKAGFEVVELIGRFLPFTTLSAMPKHPLLVKAYLRMRPAWRLLGRQFLAVARKPAAPAGLA